MASGSWAPAPPAATPKISGAFSSPNLTSNRELLSLSRSLEHSTPSKTTGSNPQNDTAIIHFFSSLIYCLIQGYAISQSILFTASVYVLGCFYSKSKLNSQPSSQDLGSVGHSSLKSEPREATDISPRDPRNLNDRPDVPTPEDIGPGEIGTKIIDESEDDAEGTTCSPREADSELDRGHVEAGCVEGITISNPENDNNHDSCSLGDADGNVNNQESESQEDEPVQGVEENLEQLDPPPANGYDVATGPGIKTPISITSGEELTLTGETLVESGPVTNTVLPDFSDGFPAPEHKESRHSHEPPEEVLASEIPKMCSFYDDLGWISHRTPKKRCNGALTKKIELHLSETENRSGVLYICKHDHYNNLYKIGMTTTPMEERKKGHPLCIQTNSSELYTTDRFVGALRAESLAKIHMASRNVPLKLCLPCRIRKQTETSTEKQTECTKQSKAHTEWFTGDYEDIKACMDFWAKTVARLYDKDTAAFIGHVDDILWTVLSSEGQRRKSRQDSTKIREHLNNPGSTPCPQRAEAERRPNTGSTGPEKIEETGLPDEMVSDDRKKLWERWNYTVKDVGATPKKKAAASRSNGGRLGARPEGPWTRSKLKKLKELDTVPLRAEDISWVVE